MEGSSDIRRRFARHSRLPEAEDREKYRNLLHFPSSAKAGHSLFFLIFQVGERICFTASPPLQPFSSVGFVFMPASPFWAHHSVDRSSPAG